MYKFVLMRHGQSQWNLEDRFTGWQDIGLTEQGRQEAQAAGKALAQMGFQFDMAYTSVLKRAIHSLWIILETLDQMWIPVHKSWRLNEKHYGALQGCYKKEMAEKYGAAKVFHWRRSYSTLPPALSTSDDSHPSHDLRYREIDQDQTPCAESLLQTQERVLTLWNEKIALDIRSGKRILMVAHGNSLRALIKHLDNISDEEISKLNIPTGTPIVYELKANLTSISSKYIL